MNLFSDLYNMIHTKSDEDPKQAQRTFIAVQDIGGDSHAGKMAGHYLWGKGKDYSYPAEDVRKEKTVQWGEQDNQQRLLDSLLKPGVLRKKKKQDFSSEYDEGSYDLKDIKDNEIFGLDGHFDRDVRYDNFPELRRNNLSDSTLNSIFGLGNYKLRSQSNLQFKKAGDKILPYGTVDHEINVCYDFEEGSFLGGTGVLLEKSGLAKPFNTKIKWQTRPFGVINVKDKKLDTSGIEWE